MSQSPQTGQFNSYTEIVSERGNVLLVSIPSNGSIQFLPSEQKEDMIEKGWVSIPSNGSIQFLPCWGTDDYDERIESQSPQTGQFNSY